jgi:anthranilate phosphoribosyltransferase
MTTQLERLLEGRHLDEEEAHDLLAALTSEGVLPAVAGAVLAALRAKGETADEVRGFVRAARGLARRPQLPAGGPLVDTCGTGGDGKGSFNISTGVALLAAACGVRIVKHGNRAVSGRSGSADVLEALGLRLPLDEAGAAALLARSNFTFLFAPHYHPAMRNLAPVRRALGVRTVFNLLGPLINPAEPPFQLLGVFSPRGAELTAQTLAGLPIERAFVVHGEGGWDEAAPTGPFLLFDVRPGRVEKKVVDPSSFGVPRCRPEELAGGDAAANAAALRDALSGQRGPHRDALVLGAALVLLLVGSAPSPGEAAALAGEAIDDGRAAAVLEDLVRVA